MSPGQRGSARQNAKRVDVAERLLASGLCVCRGNALLGSPILSVGTASTPLRRGSTGFRVASDPENESGVHGKAARRPGKTAPAQKQNKRAHTHRKAKKGGAKRFCIVTSGRRVSEKELGKIADMVSSVRSLGLLPCATLGLLSPDDLITLRKAGLERYHNNLETSKRFFPSICTTHTYEEKVSTIRSAKDVGLSVCCGGIFGLGETWEGRIDMAFALREIGPDSVPINFFTPIPGTKLSKRKPLDPLQALKIISIYRLILPHKQIRVCGGRLQALGEFNSLIFFAGADGLLVWHLSNNDCRRTQLARYRFQR